MRDATATPLDQPPPVPNASRPVWDMVIEDMRERDRVGRARYGTPLQAGNGRDALADAYAEALDLVVYLKQALVERDAARSSTTVLPMMPRSPEPEIIRTPSVGLCGKAGTAL